MQCTEITLGSGEKKKLLKKKKVKLKEAQESKLFLKMVKVKVLNWN